MEFTDEEKKLFELNDNESFNIYSLDNYLLDIYSVEQNEEMKHNLSVTLNFIKRMIIEFSKNKNFNINGDEKYNVDDLLKNIIVSDDKNEILKNFNPLLYKNTENLYKYFAQITKDLPWEDLQDLAREFNWLNDGFRTFFAENLQNIINITEEIYFNIERKNDDDFPLMFNDNIDNVESPIITVSNDDNDDEWAIDNAELDNEKSTSANFFEFEDWASDNSWLDDAEINSNSDQANTNKEEITKDKLIEVIKFINGLEEWMKYNKIGKKVIDLLYEIAKQKKLEDFYNNAEFSINFDKIMQHDKNHCSYYFHGTQSLKDAISILDEGLGMMQDNLTTTSYRELSKDEVILYERGFGGEIGHDAIVIINVPKNEIGEELNVVHPKSKDLQIHFNPSGLQGLNGEANYIVPPEFIIGYVDKKNKQVIFNPKYKNYETSKIEDKHKTM